MTPSMWLAATVVMAAAATLHASVGFGANLLAGPLLALLDPELVPGPIVLTVLVVNVVVVWREPLPHGHDRHPWRELRWPLLGLVPGSVLGALTVASVDPDRMAVLLSALVLAVTAMVASGLAFRRTPPTMLGAGAASGYLSATGGIGGAAMALVHVDVEGPELRRTLSRFLAVTAGASIVSLVAVGEMGGAEVGAALALLPGVGLGLVAAELVRPHVDRGRVRPVVLGVIAASATVVLVRSLLG